MVIAVLSGKGGTGKTTVVAALSELIGKGNKVDCDVDAPNLYLFYDGIDIEKNSFYGSKTAKIKENICIKCKKCEEVCKFGAIKNITINPLLCEGCNACVICCPKEAISLVEQKTADTFVTKTKKGTITRATMEIGSDGSGKLVTELRKKSKQFSMEDEIQLLDGSPGIGCLVIASITDTDIALIVTEPTKSGLNDLKRIVELSKHFQTKVLICINKFDINTKIAAQIEAFAKENELIVVGKIPFDTQVMEAVNGLRPITEFTDSKAKKEIEVMWNRIKDIIKDIKIKVAE